MWLVPASRLGECESSFAGDDETAVTAVVLQYPNGRIHETAVDFELQPGDRFDLYGRTWIAEQITIELWRRAAFAEMATTPRRILCVTLES